MKNPILLFAVLSVCAPEPVFADSQPDPLAQLIAQAIDHGPDKDLIARVFAKAVRADSVNAPLTGSHAEDAALLGVYAKHESGGTIVPVPASHDAKDGTSCGVLQMPCAIVRRTTLAQQALLWLRWARQGGLAALDSSPSRAAARQQEAHAVVAAALR
jgi:hypothetical protein